MAPKQPSRSLSLKRLPTVKIKSANNITELRYGTLLVMSTSLQLKNERREIRAEPRALALE